MEATDMDLQSTPETLGQWLRPCTLPNWWLPKQSGRQLGCGWATRVSRTRVTYTSPQPRTALARTAWGLGVSPPVHDEFTISTKSSTSTIFPHWRTMAWTPLQSRHPRTTNIRTRLLRGPNYSQDTLQPPFHYTTETEISNASSQRASQPATHPGTWWTKTLHTTCQTNRDNTSTSNSFIQQEQDWLYTSTQSTATASTTTLHCTNRHLGPTSLWRSWSLGRTSRGGQRRPRVPTSNVNIRQTVATANHTGHRYPTRATTTNLGQCTELPTCGNHRFRPKLLRCWDPSNLHATPLPYFSWRSLPQQQTAHNMATSKWHPSPTQPRFNTPPTPFSAPSLRGDFSHGCTCTIRLDNIHIVNKHLPSRSQLRQPAQNLPLSNGNASHTTDKQSHTTFSPNLHVTQTSSQHPTSTLSPETGSQQQLISTDSQSIVRWRQPEPPSSTSHKTIITTINDNINMTPQDRHIWWRIRTSVSTTSASSTSFDRALRVTSEQPAVTSITPCVIVCDGHPFHVWLLTIVSSFGYTSRWQLISKSKLVFTTHLFPLWHSNSFTFDCLPEVTNYQARWAYHQRKSHTPRDASCEVRIRALQVLFSFHIHTFEWYIKFLPACHMSDEPIRCHFEIFSVSFLVFPWISYIYMLAPPPQGPPFEIKSWFFIYC